MSIRRQILGQVLLFLASTWTAGAWSPGTGNPTAVEGFVVDPANRRDVLAFYQTIYQASEGYAARMAWTGNVTTGVPGTTAALFKDDVRRRINFYRALTALPADITFSSTKSSKCQEASLMFSANNNISHTPTASWTYYTANAAEAAGNSNLALGTYGPDAIDGLIEDNGSGNEVAGHRRWFLYSQAKEMGTGDIPFNGSFNAANTVWVIGNFKAAPTPQFIYWPNKGFSPIGLTPLRWSLSYPGASFTSAAVTMSQNGTNVPLTVVSRTATGYGDNTIIWEPTGLPSTLSADRTYAISVTGITGAGIPTSHSYNVILFDPNNLGEQVTLTGNLTPPVTGGTYNFNPIEQADQYQARVTKYSSAGWTEGAEDSPTPQITNLTAGALRQTTVKRTAAKGFQLTFPTINDNTQIIEIAREIVPTSTSQLVFYDLFRFATTVSRLSAEVSTDNGLIWTEIWGRNGNGNTSSAGWDTSFNPRSVSLAAYSNLAVRVRFRFWFTSSAFVGITSNTGVFLDDISVTSAGELVQPTVTSLGAVATAFSLNQATAGGALSAGTQYYLQVRPNVGTKWFSYGSPTIVTPRPLTGFETFIQTQYPMLSGDPNADYDGDFLADIVEYAFGFNPTVVTSHGQLPQGVVAGSNFGLMFTQPAGVSEVLFGMQWSPDLQNWTDLTDTGTGANHVFSISTTNRPRVFLRHVVTPLP